jgi:putative ABC transport system substrate-binding protein
MRRRRVWERAQSRHATTFTATLVVLLAVVFVVPLAGEAQQTGKVPRIGYLVPFPSSNTLVSRSIEEFRQGLRELGWVEGQNIVIEYRFAEGQFDRLPDLAAELVQLKMDVIVAMARSAAVAAKNATATVPIIFFGAADPVEVGLVASLPRPGANVTGLTYSVGMETVTKSLELLKAAVPKVRRVAVLSNSANPNQTPLISDLKVVAYSLGLRLQLLKAQGPDEFDGAFAAMAKEHAAAVLVVSDMMFLLHRVRLADLTTKNRLPSMHGVREMVEGGGLMSYGPNAGYLSRHVAIYVDKILKGAKPADLPVEQPTKFELVINVKTAKALGLTIPPSLLGRADEVIQ